MDKDSNPIVDVEFHDSFSNRAIRIVDRFGFTMGAFGDFGVILASPKIAGSKSTILYQRFETGKLGNWDVSLSQDEEVVGMWRAAKSL